MPTDQVNPVRRPDLKRDLVYDWLKRRLTTGHLCFGERLSIREISGQTGASRFPVQAAVNDLQVEGFLQVIPQSGVRVVCPTVVEIQDFFLLFSRVEGILAELSALRRSDALLGRMQAVQDKIRALDSTESVSGERYRRLNQTLHGLLHTAANSPHLQRAAKANWSMSDFLINQSNLFRSHLEESVDQHDEVLAAISARDAPAARREMEAHIMSFGADVISNMFKDRMPASRAL
jgi:DNA-binding GntR family transcriptional regulator